MGFMDKLKQGFQRYDDEYDDEMENGEYADGDFDEGLTYTVFASADSAAGVRNG